MLLRKMLFASQAVVMLSGCAPSASADHIRVLRQVFLSEHSVAPYLIERAPDGGYLVGGSSGSIDTYGWATRVDSEGRKKWEILDGPADGWNAQTPNINRITGAVMLSNDRTLLCGIKSVGHENNRGRLLIVGADGAVVSQADLYPEGNAIKYSAQIRKCLRWSDGVAVLGFAGSGGKSVGWLVRLDGAGAVVWEKFIPCAAALDVLEAPNHDLLVLSMDDADTRNSRLDRLDKAGNDLLTRRIVGQARFIRPVKPDAEIRIATEELPDGPTSVLRLDSQFKEPAKPTVLTRFSPRAGYELVDRSIALFGGGFNGEWNASVIRVSSKSSWKDLPLEPSTLSGSFSDATPIDTPGTFATVLRSRDFRGVLVWISLE